MTTEFHLTGPGDDYENVRIAANTYKKTKAYDSFTVLTISLPNAPYSTNQVSLFVDKKNTEDFAERIYDALMSVAKTEEDLPSGGREEQ